MRLRFVLMAAALAMAPAVSKAQVKVDLFTTATESTPVDFSNCAAITARCDQSVEDSSTDATLEIRACESASSPWQSCALVRTCPGEIPDATDVSIGSAPTTKPYLMSRAASAPSSDTARVILTCAEERSDRQRGCRTVAFDSAAVYGPYTIYGSSLRFDLDGYATDSTYTTGAVATVTGCTDFGSTLSYCSCDMVGGGDTCQEYNGSTGYAGFTVDAPRTAEVEIESATQPGTFTLCSW